MPEYPDDDGPDHNGGRLVQTDEVLPRTIAAAPMPFGEFCDRFDVTTDPESLPYPADAEGYYVDLSKDEHTWLTAETFEEHYGSDSPTIH